MIFEPTKKNGKLVIDNEEFARFCNEFCIKSYVPNCGFEFSRGVYALSKLIVFGNNHYSYNKVLYDENCGFTAGSYTRLLFDHCYMFKDLANRMFLVTFPYSTAELSSNIFNDLLHKFGTKKNCLKDIDLVFINNRFKFIENGDIMLAFMPHGHTCTRDAIVYCSDGYMLGRERVFKPWCKDLQYDNDFLKSIE